jgi:hypothetical protein
LFELRARALQVEPAGKSSAAQLSNQYEQGFVVPYPPVFRGDHPWVLPDIWIDEHDHRKVAAIAPLREQNVRVSAIDPSSTFPS